MEIDNILHLQKRYRWELQKLHHEHRKSALQRLHDLILQKQQDILNALHQDFQKTNLEALQTEIIPCLHELRFAIHNLHSWVQPKKVKTPWIFWGASSRIHYEPKGTVLIISPWNYPFYLAMAPLIAAIAAGNTVILKPSELTTATSQVLQEILQQIFPNEWVAVFQGDARLAEKLTHMPFDHIFFTGSTQVGFHVAAAAAKNLVPTTLELGGKSPCIVDQDVDLDKALSKIIWGKFTNAGQTCVAPDYLMVDEKLYPLLVEKMKTQLHAVFSAPEFIKEHYTGIISDRHLQRLDALLIELQKLGTSVFQFPSNSPGLSRKFLPTLVLQPPWTSALMKEEIFGPLLPILSYKDPAELFDLLHQHEKPLAMYIFTKNQKFAEKILRQTSCGGACINDVLIHLANPHLPFGGIGQSGMGNYHGHHGFLTFSHSKAVFQQAPWDALRFVLYPPAAKLKLKILHWMARLF
jgi:aldehyde dehydrogenase (NAD+)